MRIGARVGVNSSQQCRFSKAGGIIGRGTLSPVQPKIGRSAQSEGKRTPLRASLD